MRKLVIAGAIAAASVLGGVPSAMGAPFGPAPPQDPTPQENKNEIQSLTRGAKDMRSAATDIRAGNLNKARSTLSDLVAFFNSLEAVVSDLFRAVHYDTVGPDDNSEKDDGLAGTIIVTCIPVIEQKAASADLALTNGLSELDGIIGG